MAAIPASSRDPGYNQAILDAVAAGAYEMPFAEVHSTAKGPSGATHNATFLMSADALKVDGFRPGAGALLMQQIADLLGCMFPTPKLRDLQWLQRDIDIPPQTIWGYLKPKDWPNVGERGQGFGLNDMTLVATMRFISSQIDRLKAGRTGIVQNTGKAWVLINDLLTHPGHGANYGWYYKGACPPSQPCSNSPATPGLWMIQGPGTDWLRHDLQQSDYAQTINLVHRRCKVDGKDMDLVDVLQDEELAPLASHEGTLKVLRQPGVPVYACQMPTTASHLLLSAQPAGDVCPTPPPPNDIEQASGRGARIIAAGFAAALVIAGFVASIHYAGRVAHR